MEELVCDGVAFLSAWTAAAVPGLLSRLCWLSRLHYSQCLIDSGTWHEGVCDLGIIFMSQSI